MPDKDAQTVIRKRVHDIIARELAGGKKELERLHRQNGYDVLLSMDGVELYDDQDNMGHWLVGTQDAIDNLLTRLNSERGDS